MKTLTGILILGSSFLAIPHLNAQVSIGGKVGVNYLIGSQKIQPDPKDAPTNPKGLGLSFGAFAGIPFSDLVGLRPELCFSFRKGKSEASNNQTLTNDTQVTGGQGAYTGSKDYKIETDQRLSYFQVNAPLTLSPSEGLRVMLGPSFNFLMGGKQNVDETTNWKGNVTGTNQQGQQVTNAIDQEDFETSKKRAVPPSRTSRRRTSWCWPGLDTPSPSVWTWTCASTAA